jgi:hypothetical protein
MMDAEVAAPSEEILNFKFVKVLLKQIRRYDK